MTSYDEAYISRTVDFQTCEGARRQLTCERASILSATPLLSVTLFHRLATRLCRDSTSVDSLFASTVRMDGSGDGKRSAGALDTSSAPARVCHRWVSGDFLKRSLDVLGGDGLGLADRRGEKRVVRDAVGFARQPGRGLVDRFDGRRLEESGSSQPASLRR